MGGAGRKPVVGTYRTTRVTYRTVDAADADIDSFDEVIDTRFDLSTEPDTTVTSGADSMLALYVLLDSLTAATLEIYARATDESTDAPVSSSSSSGFVGSWVFYEQITVDVRNLLHVMWPLPADEYKVMVTAITGTGSVVIRESHSA